MGFVFFHLKGPISAENSTIHETTIVTRSYAIIGDRNAIVTRGVCDCLAAVLSVSGSAGPKFSVFGADGPAFSVVGSDGPNFPASGPDGPNFFRFGLPFLRFWVPRAEIPRLGPASRSATLSTFSNGFRAIACAALVL